MLMTNHTTTTALPFAFAAERIEAALNECLQGPVMAQPTAEASPDEHLNYAHRVAASSACAVAYSRMRGGIQFMQREIARGEMTEADAKVGLISELLDLATQGADDTWSGRRNDAARFANDERNNVLGAMRNWIMR